MPRGTKRKQSEPATVSGGGAGAGTGGRPSPVVSAGVVPRMSARVTYTRRLDELNANLAAATPLAGIVILGEPWSHAAFTCTVGSKKYVFNFNDVSHLGELLARGEYPREYTAHVGGTVYPKDGFHRVPWVTEFERPMMQRTSFFNGVPDAQPGKGTCYLFATYCAAIFAASGNSLEALIDATCDDDVGWRAFYRRYADDFEAVMSIPARLPAPRPGEE